MNISSSQCLVSNAVVENARTVMSRFAVGQVSPLVLTAPRKKSKN
jgi:hypothetical protein